jgi:hypothetical protein
MDTLIEVLIAQNGDRERSFSLK